MLGLIKTLNFITSHPLTRDAKLSAIGRFLRWQMRSRLQQEVIVPWVGTTSLAVRGGMTGATGNIYCGLHEFADMAFLLHFLRPGDVFIDAGANVGAYTILASGVIGARTWAIEPDPVTIGRLKRNIDINGLDDRVTICPVALGDRDGDIRFTVGLDTVNRVGTAQDHNTRTVRQTSLDAIARGLDPSMIKLDVEGSEGAILRAAGATLANPALKAVETEALSREIESILQTAGFARCFYDPFRRELSDQPKNYGDNNALYVRDRKLVEMRLQTAVRLRVLHHLL